MGDGATSTDRFDAPRLVVRSLVCTAHVEQACVLLGTLLEACLDPIRLALHDDGTLGPRDVAELEARLPGSHVVVRASADQATDELLRDFPSARAYRYEHPLALKLLDAVMLERESATALCDSDVLFRRPFRGLDRRSAGSPAVVLMKDATDGVSVPFRTRYLSMDRVKVVHRPNTGLMYMDTTAHDIEFIDWFLSKPTFRSDPHLVEQTCWGALASRAGSGYWDPAQVLMPRETTGDDEVVAAHYHSNARSLLQSVVDQPPPLLSGERVLRVVPAVTMGLVRSVPWRLRRRMSAAGKT